MSDIDYAQLDPGIRDVVRKLRDAGYETTDSGDGVSKPADERVFHQPHVVIFLTPEQSEHALIYPLYIEAILGPEWYVEANYSTRDRKWMLTCLRHEDYGKGMEQWASETGR